MADVREELPPARPGRCSVHPGAAEVGRCEVCGRAMCVSCAIPIRGALVGSECLSIVLDDSPVPFSPPGPPGRRGDALVLSGFGLVLAASVLPWSSFGDASGFFQAWSLHWSLLSVGAAAAGFAAALAFRLRPPRAWIEASVILTLAAVTALGAVLHAVHPPPPVSRVPAYAWLLPVLGACLAGLGVGLKIAGLWGPRSLTRSAHA